MSVDLDQSTTPIEAQAKDAPADWLPAGQDAFLTRLVEYANSGVELPVTLWVGGRMISGLLTSGEHFFKTTLESFGLNEPQPEGSNAAVMAEDFQEWVDLYKEPMTEAPQWLHLKDAQTFKGDGATIPSDGGVYWRGRISSVDGFHLGTLKVQSA